ncbi:hypothetical protein EOPP23_08990 [Endozoicomonas sp. OPT23]|uniref:hypothetical protein n=1 Tax=Endozoicomonas sp. OPT23 TaxID=2072845 RepID=UPI00129A5CAF|nr:hypothetical protein [Endozoicomonas sp. OPT23]MRI33117.1 hypothetical protein [Endozoicomonas sp. OPT23]
MNSNIPAVLKKIELALLAEDWDKISEIDSEVKGILESYSKRNNVLSNAEMDQFDLLGNSYQLLIASCQQEQEKIADRLRVNQKINKKMNDLKGRLDP